MGKQSRSKSAALCGSNTDTDLYQPGDYVSLKCQKYKEFLPQIGKVITVKDATLKVEWLEGEYTEEFKFWKGRRGKTIIEEFPKRAVMGKVTLTASMRLTNNDIATLKDNYTAAEFV